jgi:hypothetical protein
VLQNSHPQKKEWLCRNQVLKFFFWLQHDHILSSLWAMLSLIDELQGKMTPVHDWMHTMAKTNITKQKLSTTQSLSRGWKNQRNVWPLQII